MGTHYLADGTEVFPEGYDPADLTELPSDYDARSYVFDGSRYVVDWTKFDAEMHDKIDIGCTEFLGTIVSVLPGQTRRYRQKYDEANAYLEETTPTDTDYPMLNAEAIASNMTLAALVNEVKALGDVWTALEIDIEAARMAAKRAVTAATDIASKEAAANVDWQAILP